MLSTQPSLINPIYSAFVLVGTNLLYLHYSFLQPVSDNSGLSIFVLPSLPFPGIALLFDTFPLCVHYIT